VIIRDEVDAPDDEVIGSRAAEPIIALKGIVKSYAMGGVEVLAIRGISLIVERGEFVAIMGTSESGKSTLMNIVGCLDVPTSGHYRLDGVNIRHLDDVALSRIRNKKIGFVFQGFNLIPRMSAIHNVELPMAYSGVKPAERRKRAVVALEMVGLGDRLSHFSSELSGPTTARGHRARHVHQSFADLGRRTYGKPRFSLVRRVDVALYQPARSRTDDRDDHTRARYSRVRFARRRLARRRDSQQSPAGRLERGVL